VNKEISRGWFQEPLGLIKSETIKLGNEVLLLGRESGEKNGTVGIQEEFQTKIEDDL
jgi:hypothetical protein